MHQPPRPPGSSSTRYPVVPQAGGLPAPTAAPEYKNAKGISLLSAPNNAIIPSRLSQTTNKNGGKECGEYVNDCVQSSIMGDTLQSKLASANESTGKRGSVAVWVPDPNNQAFAKFAHAGIILGETQNEWIIKSSNLAGDGRLTTNYVPKASILGYKTTNLA